MQVIDFTNVFYYMFLFFVHDNFSKMASEQGTPYLMLIFVSFLCHPRNVFIGDPRTMKWRKNNGSPTKSFGDDILFSFLLKSCRVQRFLFVLKRINPP